MVTKITLNQKKLIKRLTLKKYRQQLGQCIISGQKNIDTADKHLLFTFTKSDIKEFKTIVGTNEPQDIAGVAKTPIWTAEDLQKANIIIVADGIQDPGNIGTIFRLCAGFKASIILIESADPTNIKTIRSSAGLFFQVPWLEISRAEAEKFITNLNRQILRLENKNTSIYCHDLESLKKLNNQLILIAGSEGQGIKLKNKGQSLSIKTEKNVESLNVGTACAIALHSLNYFTTK